MPSNGASRNPSAPQADAAILETLRGIALALLSDNLHRSMGSVGLQPYHRPKHMAGTAVTVRARGGDITNAVVGGILSYYGATIQLSGMVIDGAIRDVAEIRERDFPVYARGINHRGPYKDGPGEINVPVSIGGMVVNPGDIIVGDQDGLLAFHPSEAPQVIAKAQAQALKEADTMLAMKEGRWDRSFIAALEARCAN